MLRGYTLTFTAGVLRQIKQSVVEHVYDQIVRGIEYTHYLMRKLLESTFETVYRPHVEKGLPNEQEAVELVREYIPWFRGFELVGNTLYVRTMSGERVSVYKLAYGQHIVVLLGLLYAISRGVRLS